MIGLLKIEDKEYVIELSDEELHKIVRATGYEKVENGKHYFSINDIGEIKTYEQDGHPDDSLRYKYANYYSNKDLALNNAKADLLLRRIRRFAAEHRTKEFHMGRDTEMYGIYYDTLHGNPVVRPCNDFVPFGSISFESEEIAKLALKEFKDRLVWYFDVLYDYSV